jgi:hypothetical protein
MLNV